MGRLKKLSHRVVFPAELKINNTTDDSAEPDTAFSLFAVVVHVGRYVRCTLKRALKLLFLAIYGHTCVCVYIYIYAQLGVERLHDVLNFGILDFILFCLSRLGAFSASHGRRQFQFRPFV